MTHPPADPLARTVAAQLERARLPAGSAGLVAVSGGADSTCLALLAAPWLHQAGLSASLVHVDHGLRPADAPAEQALCRDLARRLGMPLHIERASASSGNQGHGPEDRARRARFAAFARVATRTGARWILLGHTRDDQVETVLLRILQGTGLDGLAAMGLDDPAPWDPAVRLVRPLLDVPRAVTRAWCAASGAPFADDPSNLDRRYLRNAVRLDIVPRLTALNPGAGEHLAALAGDARDASTLIEQLAAERYDQLVRPAAAGIALDRAGFLQQPPALQARLVMLAWQQLRPGEPPLSRRGIQASRDVAASGGGRRVALPGGACWLAGPSVLQLLPGPPPDPPPPPPARALDPGETVAFGAWSLRLCATPGEPAPAAGATVYRERFAAAAAPLGVRAWQPGDRIAIEPAGHKKLQDLFTDSKTPRFERTGWPVVTAGDGDVLWLPGLRRSRRYRPRPGEPELGIEAWRPGTVPGAPGAPLV